MTTADKATRNTWVIDMDGLARILKNLSKEGFHLIGPKVEDHAIVYDRIYSLKDLPQGWSDEQGPGYYRIRKSENKSFFDFTVGPNSWKKFLHSPHLRLWQATRQGTSFRISQDNSSVPAYAFIGVRPCEIRAMEIQDGVFCGKQFTEPHYNGNRNKAFILAVNCGRSNSTCFCASMKSGPKAEHGFDLALTEFFENGSHLFLIETGSDSGGAILEGVIVEEPEVEQLAHCQDLSESVASNMTRHLETSGLRETLLENMDHPNWEAVAERCLSCANCTMVCPTCFCTTVEDTTDLTGDHAERWRRWDSCFTMDFSYVAGGHIRSSTKSRYRQWMTHKLATWHDQFGTSGCVGCGRCIAWCPVGIDITEEAEALQASAKENQNKYTR
jgi:sulfhydrogenase subunit beta (sulfur reductase)